jgi:hypothetical protein
MILTALRVYENRNCPQTVVCTDSDFQIALNITKSLIHHAILIFQQLSVETLDHMPSITPQQRSLQTLLQEFDRKKYLDAAKTLNTPDKTADKQFAKQPNRAYRTWNLSKTIAISSKSLISPRWGFEMRYFYFQRNMSINRNNYRTFMPKF